MKKEEPLVVDITNVMSDNEDCSPGAEELASGEAQYEELVSEDSVSIQEVSEEVASEVDVSILGRKRKHSSGIELGENCVSNEVSTSPKRVHI